MWDSAGFRPLGFCREGSVPMSTSGQGWEWSPVAGPCMQALAAGAWLAAKARAQPPEALSALTHACKPVSFFLKRQFLLI